jgi:hypothetical protein
MADDIITDIIGKGAYEQVEKMSEKLTALHKQAQELNKELSITIAQLQKVDQLTPGTENTEG